MQPAPECASCLLKWVYDRAKVTLVPEERFGLIRDISQVLARDFRSSFNLGIISNRITQQVSEVVSKASSHYNDFKQDSNTIVKQMLPQALHYIHQGLSESQRLERAISLATVSNVAPIGKPSAAFTFQDAYSLIEGKHPPLTIMKEALPLVQKASRILYLADNSGEIGFDSLLISELTEMGARVCLAVKSPSFFEDATLEDAHFFSLNDIADNLFTVNGFFVANECDEQLVEEFQKCELVIAKGTGNYESSAGELDGKPCIHMLKIKCRPIANQIKEKSGMFVATLHC